MGALKEVVITSDIRADISTLESSLPSYMLQNWVINGDHRVNQRKISGATSAVNVTYEATDQFETLLTGVTANKELVTSSQPTALIGSQSVKYTATSTASGTMGARQYIEDNQLFEGKVVFASCWVKSDSANARLLIVETGGNTTSSTAHTGGGAWELLTVQVTVDASITELIIQVMISNSAAAAVTVTTGEVLEYTGMMMIFGDQSIAFVARDKETETRKCQRYFYRAADGGTNVNEYITNGRVDATTSAFGAIRYPVEMRAVPAMVVSAAAHFAVRLKASSDIACTVFVLETSTPRGGNLSVQVAAGLTAGESIQIKVDNASALLDFDAQL